MLRDGFTFLRVQEVIQHAVLTMHILKIGPQCERVPRERDIVKAGGEWT